MLQRMLFEETLRKIEVSSSVWLALLLEVAKQVVVVPLG